jgi:hypothetical protein
VASLELSLQTLNALSGDELYIYYPPQSPWFGHTTWDGDEMNTCKGEVYDVFGELNSFCIGYCFNWKLNASYMSLELSLQTLNALSGDELYIYYRLNSFCICFNWKLNASYMSLELSLQTLNAHSGDELYIYYRFPTMYLYH